jgi:hypothetical protein
VSTLAGPLFERGPKRTNNLKIDVAHGELIDLKLAHTTRIT